MALVKLLKWDSNFFGFNIADVIPKTINDKKIVDILNYCKKNKVNLLQFRCNAHHKGSIRLAEQNKFHFVDNRMTFLKKINQDEIQEYDTDNSINIRMAIEDDVPELENLVKKLYRESRYYFDKNFPNKNVSSFYRDWIIKSIKGKFDDMVWVICFNGEIVGCCSIAYKKGKNARIGLFGIKNDMSKRGFGKLLIRKVLFFLKNNNSKSVSVVTQGRNYKAQRFYQSAGFYIDKIEIYYHLWWKKIIVNEK